MVLIFVPTGHFVHSLIEKDPKAYKKLVNEIIPLVIGGKEYRQRLDRYTIARHGIKFSKASAERQANIEEEFICDTVADLMLTEKFWDVLSQKDMTLAQKFLKALKDLLAKLKGNKEAYISRTEKVFGENLDQVIALAQKFVVEASGKSNLSSLLSKETSVTATGEAQTTAAATPKENLSVPPESDQSVSSVPSVQTPSGTAAPVEQVLEQGKKKKITIADLNEQAKAKREAKQGKAETATAEQTDDATDRQAADYEQRFGTVINTDNAKLLFKDDGYDPHDAESVKKFHPQASNIVRKLFNKFLKERKGKGNGFVVFTGGGNGSGKSSVMTGDAVKNADFVFDSTMVNYEAAKDSIQKVIDNGQTPLLAFAYRNPADAWFNGVQKRNQSADGHIVPEATFINTHAIAKENFLKLVRDFGDKVQYIIKEVADGKAFEITLEELENKPKYTKDQIKEAINAESYTGARTVLERLQRSNDTPGAKTGSELAPGRTEKRSDEVQRIDTGADRDSGRVSGGQKSGSVTSAESIISKITSAKVGSRERIMAFTELPDGEHTVNGKSFTKKGNAFTLDGKTLNAREIEKATRTTSEKMRKTVEETVSDAEIGNTPKTEAKPEKEPTISDKMRGKGKKETAAPSAEKSAPEKIEDYGEKIGGARKDQYKQEVQSHLEDDLSDEEIYNLPASKVFPIPDYAKLAEQGVPKKSLALLKALREAFFPNKPTTRFKSKVGKYVKSIKELRSWAVDILKNADAWEKDIVAKTAEADKILKEIAKLEEEENKLRKDGFDYYSSEWRSVIQKKSELMEKRWEILRQNEKRQEILTTGKALAKLDLDYSSFNSPYIVDSYTMSDGSVHYRAYEGKYYLPGYGDIDNTDFDAVVKLVADEIARKQEAKQKEKAAKGKLDPKKLYIKIAYNPLTDENSYAIYNVKDGFRLKDGFETREDAQKYASSEKGFAELSKLWDEISDIKERRTILSDRIGTNYRNGRNITPQELAETFGFRGIEFGKWAEQEHRQARLNETFDALMDLSELLGISPRAISLGGKLGLAFGARGRGHAMAHFESEKFVINLTKTMGAGSLAHEWLHALDNYFAKQTGRKLSMSTDMQFSSLKEGGMRDELAQAYRDLVIALQMSDMMRRSRKHSKYWSRIWEVAARAFERYVVDEAAAQNTKNDFLSSVLTENDMSELMQETTPLALDKDMKTIAPAFDKFFATLQEKVDESGNTVLFSKQGDLQTEQEKRYYQVPWKEGLQKAVNNKNVREPVFVSKTPEVFRKIGFTSLPMLMNVRHLRLNYYNKTDFEKMFGTMRQGEHAHDLRDKLNGLPTALEHPLAIVVNQTPNATPGSVVAITDMNVNGKKVVVPVLIESINKVENGRVDSHLVLTVYDSNNWMEQFLTPAIKAEKKGIGIFYFDEAKASRYGAYSNKIGSIPTGFVHNITEAGIKVKHQIETFQFKKYFGDWQNDPKNASKVVDENGKPLMVYNGGKSGISIFDIAQTGKSNEFAKVGFWFSDKKSLADSFSKNWYNQTWNGKEYIPGEVYAVYLNIRNPKIYESKTSDKAKIDRLDKENIFLNKEVIELNRKYQFGMVSYEENNAYNIAMRNGFSDPKLDEDTKKYYQDEFPQAIKDGEKVRTLKQKINANVNEIKRERLADAYEQFELDVYETSGQSANDYGRSLKDPLGAEKFRKKLQSQGYDGIIIKGTDYDSSLTDDKQPVNQYVAFESTQIKSATDNIGTFDGTNPDIHFSLTGDLDLGDTSLSPEDYRRSIDPLFDFVMEYTDGVVNPGSGHIGEEFTGSYISPEYKEYSVKRKQGAKESDASYQRYLDRREESLNNASGTPVKTANFPGGPIRDQSRSTDHLYHHRRSKWISFYLIW